jgi:hypothetical protein
MIKQKGWRVDGDRDQWSYMHDCCCIHPMSCLASSIFISQLVVCALTANKTKKMKKWAVDATWWATRYTTWAPYLAKIFNPKSNFEPCHTFSLLRLKTFGWSIRWLSQVGWTVLELDSIALTWKFATGPALTTRL